MKGNDASSVLRKVWYVFLSPRNVFSPCIYIIIDICLKWVSLVTMCPNKLLKFNFYYCKCFSLNIPIWWLMEKSIMFLKVSVYEFVYRETNRSTADVKKFLVFSCPHRNDRYEGHYNDLYHWFSNLEIWNPVAHPEVA